MSDIGLDWGPLDYALITLLVGWPGLAIGLALGAIAWRRHRTAGRSPRRGRRLRAMARRVYLLEAQPMGMTELHNPIGLRDAKPRAQVT